MQYAVSINSISLRIYLAFPSYPRFLPSSLSFEIISQTATLTPPLPFLSPSTQKWSFPQKKPIFYHHSPTYFFQSFSNYSPSPLPNFLSPFSSYPQKNNGPISIKNALFFPLVFWWIWGEESGGWETLLRCRSAHTRRSCLTRMDTKKISFYLSNFVEKSIEVCKKATSMIAGTKNQLNLIIAKCWQTFTFKFENIKIIIAHFSKIEYINYYRNFLSKMT